MKSNLQVSNSKASEDKSLKDVILLNVESNIPEDVLDVFTKAYEEGVLRSTEIVWYKIWKKFKNSTNQVIKQNENQDINQETVLYEHATNSQTCITDIVINNSERLSETISVEVTEETTTETINREVQLVKISLNNELLTETNNVYNNAIEVAQNLLFDNQTFQDNANLESQFDRQNPLLEQSNNSDLPCEVTNIEKNVDTIVIGTYTFKVFSKS